MMYVTQLEHYFTVLYLPVWTPRCYWCHQFCIVRWKL